MNGAYAVIRCNQGTSIHRGEMLRDGFESAGEAALWKLKNAPGPAFMICRIESGLRNFLSSDDEVEIGTALHEARASA